MMATIPPHGDIIIVEVGDDACIIKDPGRNDEKVLYRFRPENRDDTFNTLLSIFRADQFDEEQKRWLSFWVGYYYAHGRKRL